MTSSSVDPVMGKNSVPKVTVTAVGLECLAWMTEPDTLYKYLQYHLFSIYFSFFVSSSAVSLLFCFGQSSALARFISIFILAWTTETRWLPLTGYKSTLPKRTDLRRRTFHNWPRPTLLLCWPTDRSRPTESKNTDPELIVPDAVLESPTRYFSNSFHLINQRSVFLL